jgi:hypothetical protein
MQYIWGIRHGSCTVLPAAVPSHGHTYALNFAQRLWGVATSFVGTDAALQKELVVALADVDPEQVRS